MPTKPGNDIAMALVQPGLREEPARTVQHHPKSAPRIPLGRSVYHAAARFILPRWRRMLGDAPWLGTAGGTRSVLRYGAEGLLRRQSSSLAVRVLLEIEGKSPAGDLLHECVRASLMQWQLTLGADGRPSRRSMRRNPLSAAISQAVIQLLSETTTSKTDALLNDISKHLGWLKTLRHDQSWLDAARLCAMVDGAILIRDRALLECTRVQLEDFLRRQDSEGWFPEQGGVDLGLLSLTIDALAHLYRRYGWEEVGDSAKRALKMLTFGVRPDGGFGGCYNARNTAFCSPYGVELLAPSFPDAASIAFHCRRRLARLTATDVAHWSGDLCALLGSRIVLTAASAQPTLPTNPPLPCDQRGHTLFAEAGLSVSSTDSYYAVVNTKRGASLHVAWRDCGEALEDDGITAIFSHKVRTSSGPIRTLRGNATATTVECAGALTGQERSSRTPRLIHKRLARFLRSLCGLFRLSRDSAGGNNLHQKLARLGPDWFERRITLEGDTIRITDRIRCCFPCQTIVCQSASPWRAGNLVDATAGRSSGRAPIYVHGGRRVTVTRTYRNGELVSQ